MLQLNTSVYPSVCDLTGRYSYFIKVKRGFYRVHDRGPLGRNALIGVCLKVKDATQNATWIFFPTKRFRRSADQPYRWFCFGCSRRVAVENFLNDKHLRFQTGASKPWLHSGR